MGGVEAARDAKAASVGENEFNGRPRLSVIWPDMYGEEGSSCSLVVGKAIVLTQSASPVVEGGDGKLMAIQSSIEIVSAYLEYILLVKVL